MIALWIGYGLVFAATFLTKKISPAVLAAVMIAVSFVFPLVDNYCGNYRLGVNEVAFKLGGSEQNKHTFGWQFGAYQLDGAKAVKEQITADEEPLPDPSYPPEMDKFSIFFGGTDPGRFVPTYMIYSALFRPDVYLITQNALADDTYMSVQRDLYGDEIWIPAKEDSAEAFNIYVDEVQRGIRPANGDLKIENGRVQVTGALGVMEINGILTRMMHDHDKNRHSFYVEESYVIPWMYPYLSPHGLIMKLNASKAPYSSKTAAKDNDFWDWYMRRLLADPMYRRDFAAQKSFSKLRAAIAGLYIRQGRYREGSQAFREACLLYPASPEATFRYVQECLLPFRKWDETLEILSYTDEIDPDNRRTASMRDYVNRIQTLLSETERLEKLRQGKGLNEIESLMLARCYFDLGRGGEAATLTAPLVSKLKDANSLKVAYTILLESRFVREGEEALNAYLKLNPTGDAEAWLQLALIQHRAGRRAAAMSSFNQAVYVNSSVVERRLQKRESDLIEIYTGWARHQPRNRQRESTSVWK
jgi:tetratricopeptide (TPR) repeat protein